LVWQNMMGPSAENQAVCFCIQNGNITSIKDDLARESCTIFRQVSSLRSSVAAFPSMNKDDFARVRATFIRRVSGE